MPTLTGLGRLAEQPLRIPAAPPAGAHCDRVSVRLESVIRSQCVCAGPRRLAGAGDDSLGMWTQTRSLSLPVAVGVGVSNSVNSRVQLGGTGTDSTEASRHGYGQRVNDCHNRKVAPFAGLGLGLRVISR